MPDSKTVEITKFITAEGVRRYAYASGDLNPVHLNEAFAKQVGLKGCILHGLCTMAYVAQAAADLAGDPLCLQRLKLRFALPVYFGDTLRIQATAEPTGNAASFRVINQNNEEVLSSTTATWTRTPAPRTPPPLKLQEVFPSVRYHATAAVISEYADAVGDPNPLYQGPNPIAPPLFSSVFALLPFKPEFDRRLAEEKDFKVIHASQEFEFYNPLRAGDDLLVEGGVERASIKAGQEFKYTVSLTKNSRGEPVVFSRSLLVMQSGFDKGRPQS